MRLLTTPPRTPIAFAALACAAALASVAPPAGAHEYWLTPSRYRAAAGDTLAIRAWVGTGFRGEARPYAPSRVKRFALMGPRTLDLAALGRNGDLEWARFVTSDAGGALIAYQSDFVPIQLEAAEFDRYLELEGLMGPLAARRKLGAKAGPGRERYARCPKTWIAGDAPAHAETPTPGRVMTSPLATKPNPGREMTPRLATTLPRAAMLAGLPLEIVPLQDPGVPGPLRVRVLHLGRPLAGALVRAWNQPLLNLSPRDPAARDSVGPALEARTGSDGIATLALARPGEWMVACVHMVRCRERAIADWESLWASLSFARLAAGK